MISPHTDIAKLLLRFMTGLIPILVLVLVRANKVIILSLKVLAIGFEVLILVSKGFRFLLFLEQIDFTLHL